MFSKACDQVFTVDIWSERRQHSFIGFIGHVFKNGVLYIHLVLFKLFRGSHTITSIKEVLEDLLKNENIRYKVCLIVTDNASYMKKAALFLFNIDNADFVNLNSPNKITVVDDDASIDDTTLTLKILP